MKQRQRAIAFVLVVLATTFVAYYAAGPSSDPAFDPQRASLKGEEADDPAARGSAFTVRVRTVENARIVTIHSTDGSQSVPNFVLTEAEEMDVHTIRLHNGFNATGVFAQGAFTLVLGSSMALFFGLDAYGTQHHAYGQPVPLRAGDAISWTPRMGSAVGWVQLDLIGRVPSGGSGMMAR